LGIILGNHSKQKRKKLLHIILIASLAVVVFVIVILALSTHRPAIYRPVAAPDVAAPVSTYITHDIAPTFYNNFQFGEPFEMIIDQNRFNEIIADGSLIGCEWPSDLGGVKFYAPAAVFATDTIMLMGTIDYASFPIVITIIMAPAIDADGNLALNLKKIKAGLFSITTLARMIGTRVFSYQIRQNPDRDWLKGLSAAFLENSPFEPVFPSYNDKNVRVSSAAIKPGKLILTFTPE
jgi:hypothetical protein